ncbi:MAG: FtsX-like permease family protein [Nanohaloarchaea archaeon]|nr:FtsX-like permease family protein [Candidatus Nanohaloarchaea archaeon]
MRFEYLRYAFKNIRHRRLRSWLTLIGIFIGIAAVVALISLGQGMQNAINEEFQKAGADRLTIQPAGGFGGAYVSEKLYQSDVEVVNRVKSVDFATGVIIRTGRVKYKEETESVSIFGIAPDEETKRFIEKVDFFLIEEGRQFKSIDNDVAILGSNIASDRFDRAIVVGEKIIVENKEFKVIGIQKKSGSPMHDNMVRITTDSAQELFDLKETEEVSMIFAKVKVGIDPLIVAEDVKKALRKDHNVKVGEEDFTVTTAQQLIEGFNNILLVIQAVLVGIAAISLVVGGIGITNTMYTSVVERTREIGIMKSVGAKNSDIISIFLMESALLGFFGGILGVIIGLSVSKGIEIMAVYAGVTVLKAYFGIELVIGALIFSMVIGTLSGVLPAKGAAEMNPVDALRSMI